MTTPSTGLTSAHRGYAYQDIVVAVRLLEMLTGLSTAVDAERMLSEDDRFDDVKVWDGADRCIGVQVKHSTVERPFAIRALATDVRGLRLDKLIRAMLLVRDGAADRSTEFEFQIVTTDLRPSADDVDSLFRLADAPRGDAIQRASRSYQIDAPSVLEQSRSGKLPDLGFEVSEVEWALSRLWILTEAPRYSADLSNPGPAEQILLRKVRDELGAGAYPNQSRSPEDVAAGLILAANAARMKMFEPSRENLLNRLRLRTDYGAVASAHPVVESLRVSRASLVNRLNTKVLAKSDDGGVVVVTGPPGHGKSWLADELERHLTENDWILSSHYCYINDADSDRESRTLIETIHGSLLSGFARQDPSLVSSNLPILAATRETLQQTLHRAAKNGPVAMVIDGVDHITRVRGNGRGANPSLGVCESLAAIELPPGVVLVVLSQPGDHLSPLTETGDVIFELPGMSDVEIEKLVMAQLEIELAEPDRLEAIRAFVTRSAGNALYATYLCREIGTHGFLSSQIESAIMGLPPFDGDLRGYYNHLYDGLSYGGMFVADSLALVNFAVTADELRQLVPRPRFVDEAMSTLAPVLRETVGSGIRIYHESFARFIRERLVNEPDGLGRVVGEVVEWLTSKGLFEDPRAYRWLLPILLDAERYAEAHAYITSDFVWRSIGAGYQTPTILRNLRIGAESAVLDGRIDAGVRCLQLGSSAHRFQGDQFESLIEYADLYSHFVGADRLAASLLDDRERVLSGRDGLLLCSAIDRLGAVAPWRQYLRAYDAEREREGFGSGAQASQDENLAELRGRLRQLSLDEPLRGPRWDLVSDFIAQTDMPIDSALEIAKDVYGLEGVQALVDGLPDKREALLCLALQWDGVIVEQATTQLRLLGAVPGRAHDLLRLGFPPEGITDIPRLRTHLIDLSRRAVEGAYEDHIPLLADWMDACAVAAQVDPEMLVGAEAVCAGDGWYRRWLLFVVALCRAEAAGRLDQKPETVKLLELLDGETTPFVGKPRAVDLYFARPLIVQTLQRALALVDDEDLSAAFDVLSSVSDATSAALMGTVMGPVSPDVLAALVDSIGTRAPSVARKGLEELGADASGFYSNLSKLQLQRSRLELSLQDHAAAEKYWEEALKLLPAYGWHKDSTIEELYGSLDTLIDSDVARTRDRLGSLQGLSERVSNHSDGRGMSHVVSQWWKKVASADPVWVISTAVPAVVENCNDPLWLPRVGLEGVWHRWNSVASLTTALATGLALEDLPLESILNLVERYASSDPNDVTSDIKRLMLQVVARADERPVSYSYTNGEALLTKDDAIVQRINDNCEAADLPRVSARTSLPVEPKEDPFGIARDRTKLKPKNLEIVPRFSAGLPGLHEMIAGIGRRDFEEGDNRESFISQVGYRLVELAQDGRVGDAEAALVELAETGLYRDGALILEYLSDGLMQHRQPTLATVAATLAWTRSRGDGWHDFGGRERIGKLEFAYSTDVNTARRVLAAEVARAVQRDSIGPSRALTIAAAEGILGQDVDAFALWDEIASIQIARAPRVSDADDPFRPYVPTVDRPDPDYNALTIHALALAICSPGREEKRRGLTALCWMLIQREGGVLELLPMLLDQCPDVITLTAVLEVLAESGRWCVGSLAPSLLPLTKNRHLSVRTLARSLVENAAAPEPQASRVDQSRHHDDKTMSLAKSAVREFCFARLRVAHSSVPGIVDAVINQAAAEFETANVGERMGNQIEALASRADFHFPDAVLAAEQAVEEALQEVGGSGRGLMFAAGLGVPGPEWELGVAQALAPNHFKRVRIEFTRVPRPVLPEGLPVSSPDWGVDGERIFEHELAVNGSWTVLGAIEQRWLWKWRDPERRAMRSLAVVPQKLAVETDPFGPGDEGDWIAQPPPTSSSLLNVAFNVDWQNGIGGPPMLLTPSPSLWIAGNLSPGPEPFTLVGPDGGLDIRLVTWRSDYLVSDYELKRPAVIGQAIYASERLMALLEAPDDGLWRFIEQIELSEGGSIQDA